MNGGSDYRFVKLEVLVFSTHDVMKTVGGILDKIERVHLQFCKSLLGVEKSTQNNYVYRELGKLSYQDIIS